MSIVAIAVSILLAYQLGRLDERGRYPRRRVDVEYTGDLADFEKRVGSL